MELRDYQREAIEAIERQHSSVRATLLVLATGLGKTVTFAALAQRIAAADGRTLVLAHRAELIDQAAATLRRFGLRVGIERAELSVGPLELPDAIVASVQTLQRARLGSYARDAFRLVVVDEAHHALAATYRTILDYFDRAKVLGVTATPHRGDGLGLHNVFDSTAYTLDLRAGIRDGWLAPLEIRAVTVESLDLSKVKVRAGELAADELEAELLRDGVMLEVAAPIAELATGRPTLVFCAGVKQAHALADTLRARGLSAAAVDGSMSAAARAAVLDDYRARRIHVVCNAMLWTEGFDDPATSCIALVRPTGTRALIAQMIGRGTRLHASKRNCLVLDFAAGRVGKLRMASAHEVLAGELIDEQAKETKKDKAERQAKERVLAALERRRWIAEVGVVYAAPQLDLDELLEALGARESGPRATERQREALQKAGFAVDDGLTRAQAAALFGVLNERRERGLCTLKQARSLRRLGFSDDLTLAQASYVLDKMAAANWRMSARGREAIATALARR